MTVLTRVTVEEAAADLSRLIEQMRQGEEVVIARARPSARPRRSS